MAESKSGENYRLDACTLILLFPFTCFGMTLAVALMFILWTSITFVLGSYIGKASHKSPTRTSAKYTVLATLGAIISHYIADLVGPLV